MNEKRLQEFAQSFREEAYKTRDMDSNSLSDFLGWLTEQNFDLTAQSFDGE